MRNIKFRAWDGKQMIYRGLHDRNWYSEDLCGKVVQVAHPNDKRLLSIMQFTGLQDKNGVDIYEGDLVKDAVLIFQVEWNTQNGKFCINPINRVNGEFDGLIEVIMYDDLGNGYFSRKDLEIIGSIHTTPELLNPSNK